MGPSVSTCTACGVAKPRTREFFRPGARARDGLRRQCRECEVARERERRADRGTRAWRLKADHGITVEEYEALFAAQGGRCGICGAAADPLDVDHCHASERIRGLLCRQCNVALGMLDDDPERLRAAAAWVEAADTGIPWRGKVRADRQRQA